jgi:hypothetical protein
VSFNNGLVVKCGRRKQHQTTGDADEARSSNIIFDGWSATQFVSSFGRLLAGSFIGERERFGNHTGDDPD